jgi:hypothetical protein
MFFTMPPLPNGRPSEPKSQPANASSEHDFDFLVGSWTVQHRLLEHRVTHSTEWHTLSGSCKTWLLLDGQGDVDDNVLLSPSGTRTIATITLLPASSCILNLDSSPD